MKNKRQETLEEKISRLEKQIERLRKKNRGYRETIRFLRDRENARVGQDAKTLHFGI